MPGRDSKGRFIKGAGGLRPSKSGGGVSFDFTGKWDKLHDTVDPERFKAALAHHVEQATRFNAQLVKREIKQRIKARKYSANAALTILLKGDSVPLVDESEMFNAITDLLINPTTAFVGVLRQSVGKDGHSLANIAAAIHQGVEIRVTQAMRNLFIVLAEATAGTRKPETLTGRAAFLFEKLRGRGVIHPLRPGTEVIRIHGRPFIRKVFEDRGILGKIKANWQAAVGAAFKV